MVFSLIYVCAILILAVSGFNLSNSEIAHSVKRCAPTPWTPFPLTIESFGTRVNIMSIESQVCINTTLCAGRLFKQEVVAAFSSESEENDGSFAWLTASRVLSHHLPCHRLPCQHFCLLKVRLVFILLTAAYNIGQIFHLWFRLASSIVV